MNSQRFSLLLVPLIVLGGITAMGQDATLDDALKNGNTSMNIRNSLEFVDKDDAADNDAATSLTVRTRLGYRTGEWAGNALFLQFQDVSALIRDYAPLDAEKDTVLDPEGTSVYQGYLDNTAVPDTLIRAGRQEMIRDDHRLMGHIGWRQQGQTFHAVSVQNKSVPDLQIILDYAWRVKTIFNTTLDLEHLVIAEGIYTGIADQRISVIRLQLDSEGDTDSDRDLATTGARLAGKAGPAEYAFDFAAQEGYADNSNDGGTMTNLFAAFAVVGVKLGVGYSQLTGADGDTRAFDTLFSTAHKFNGWADEFASTNGGGLELGLTDTYLQVGSKFAGMSFLGRYHVFTAEADSTKYGTELDLLLSKGLTENLKGLVKAALYTADSSNDSGVAAADETIIWLRLEYGF